MYEIFVSFGDENHRHVGSLDDVTNFLSTLEMPRALRKLIPTAIYWLDATDIFCIETGEFILRANHMIKIPSERSDSAS